MTRRSKQRGMNLGGCIASPIIALVLIVILVAVAPWLLLVIVIVAAATGMLSHLISPITGGE